MFWTVEIDLPAISFCTAFPGENLWQAEMHVRSLWCFRKGRHDGGEAGKPSQEVDRDVSGLRIDVLILHFDWYWSKSGGTLFLIGIFYNSTFVDCSWYCIAVQVVFVGNIPRINFDF